MQELGMSQGYRRRRKKNRGAGRKNRQAQPSGKMERQTTAGGNIIYVPAKYEPKPRVTKAIDPDDPVGQTIRRVLATLLQLRRGHNSQGEWAACAFLKDSGFTPVVNAQNEVIAYTAGDPFASTCIMGHIDSVHYGDKEEVHQQVVRSNEGFWSLAGPGDCLGADDAAGVAAIFAMLEARPDLRYIIHRGEECGGIGAKAIQGTQAVQDLKVVVSLDRRGYNDIIKHQSGGAGCSMKFVDWLAGELNQRSPDSGYPWSEGTGTYTDSAEYMGSVSECTNLSVGYFGAHTSSETLDEGFLIELTHALIGIDWDDAPVVRDPAAFETRFERYHYEYDRWDVSSYRNYDRDRYASYGGVDLEAGDIEGIDIKETRVMASLTHLVNSYPAEVAQVLRDYGFDDDDLRLEINSKHYDGN